jgi:Tfp pilus assembly protein PilN
MMLLDFFDHVAGVELKIIGDNHYDCCYTLVKKNKGKLEDIDHKHFQGTLVQVLEKLPRNHPVALCLSGKGVLHRSIEQPEGQLLPQLFVKAFPAVEEKDFYVQEYASEKAALVSIVRKAIVDDLLDKMERAGIKVYALALGGMVSVHVWHQLKEKGNTLAFGGHQFNVAENLVFLDYRYAWSESVAQPDENRLGNTPGNHIVAYASALQFFLYNQVDQILARVPQVEKSVSDYFEQLKLKKNAMLFLFVLFFTLLISFLMYTHYNAKNALLTQQVGHLSATADQVELMQRNIVRNEAELARLNWNGGYNYGFLTNEIGKSRPRQLRLSSMVFSANTAAQEKQERSPQITVTGETDNLTAVNNWIFLLKENKWVKTVKLLRYQDNPEQGNYSFSILITY